MCNKATLRHGEQHSELSFSLLSKLKDQTHELLNRLKIFKYTKQTHCNIC